ncbi:OLC1v1024333C1 [Oldenlandia corymbosa var. corymbosa]|uniref:OLC1v1024333C1 n=1 Tax=Oldenlandia corymbosa var. corymbosa TaxID=529605 RepID=A0AAV1C551_OLDCO|nr:OLC1v1024333C1 [Oldenlandia corymbosa var. corymbosa]
MKLCSKGISKIRIFVSFLTPLLYAMLSISLRWSSLSLTIKELSSPQVVTVPGNVNMAMSWGCLADLKFDGGGGSCSDLLFQKKVELFVADSVGEGGGIDVVLGVDWMAAYSLVICHYKVASVTMHVDGRAYTLKGYRLETPTAHRVSCALSELPPRICIVISELLRGYPNEKFYVLFDTASKMSFVSSSIVKKFGLNTNRNSFFGGVDSRMHHASKTCCVEQSFGESGFSFDCYFNDISQGVDLLLGVN